jgi:uncharacterized membrane protein YraQ (UPF0718 family)
MLFPLSISGMRLAMALVLVLVGSLLVSQITSAKDITALAPVKTLESTWAELWLSYCKSLAQISLKTVPVILVGIWLSMWITSRLPMGAATDSVHRTFVIPIVSVVAVLLTLPTLFEIPLALSLLAVGAPAGAAAALLFAGPATNLASLFVIGRHSNWRVAGALATLVWSIAVAGGLLLS